jgi:FAD/FMN-containing dehydrogenase/Fe-S oxidoreductase
VQTARGQGDPQVERLFEALEAEGFRGEMAADAASRIVQATDNSIYELAPRAVLFPREPDDLNRIMRVARSLQLPLAARGGGTGTNGQALTDGIVVDCARHLTRIESIDPQTGIAVVEPGVILSELNRVAAKHGLLFGPSVSTASRATLGGMAATDASGKGSRVFGRTSDQILAMDVVLSDGSDWRAEPMDAVSFEAHCGRQDQVGEIHRVVRDVLDQEGDEIARVFPVMNRGLTGYNLKDISQPDGRYSLTRLLAGSEGTLALTKRLTLQLVRRKPLRALMVVAYDGAMAALGDAQRLVTSDPVALEFIDDRIIGLAREDAVWADIAAVLAQRPGRIVRGLNFVEIQADHPAELEAASQRLTALLAAPPASVISSRLVTEPYVIAQLWSLREKCVGLLGRMAPDRQGTAFVEDAAVPPENLAAFVAKFRDVLDAEGLAYGMFGHADVGCVHVRPALDMRLPEDQARIRRISDHVAKLAQDHGGVIWGEHGKGFRGAYVPMVFGDRLYRALCRIKRAFDPDNLLNPGKIAAPDPETALTALDAVPFRGARDAVISAVQLDNFAAAVKCNGNGQCHNRQADDGMCPSYKATGDKRQSPKGRAALLREWLRLSAGGAGALAGATQLAELEEQVHDSLSTCLSCKACASQCPVKVDIPAMGSRFFDDYYRRHARPFRHFLLAAMEPLSPIMRCFPSLSNIAMRVAAPLLRAAGLVDLPLIRPPRTTRDRSSSGDRPEVTIVEDSFLATYDGEVIDACQTLLESLGYRVRRTHPLSNGKALHVMGMRAAFTRLAQRRASKIAALMLPSRNLVSIEPVVSAMERDEYRSLAPSYGEIRSVETFLADEIAAGRIAPRLDPVGSLPLHLMRHCTERGANPQSAARWSQVFAAFGIELKDQPAGCCGMAGAFGHELPNQDMSRRLFDLSWREPLERLGDRALLTGFSCRCQADRFGLSRPMHPLQYLAERLSGQVPPPPVPSVR